MNLEMSLYPWHVSVWKTLNKARNEGRLPHAILLTGAPGSGLHTLAESLSRSLLCASPDDEGHACQTCQPCRLFEAENHPEYHLCQPEEEGTGIKVDQVRALIQFCQLQARISHAKVVLIAPAEKMNESAANSLLKTLEEPAENTHLILISHAPAQLPITIRSRCQQFNVQANAEEIQDHLAQSVPENVLYSLQRRGLGPLYLEEKLDSDTLTQLRDTLNHDLLQLTQKQTDALSIAKAWQAFDLQAVFFWLQSLVEDVIRLKLLADQADNTSSLSHPDKRNSLQTIAEAIESKRLFKLYDHVTQALRLVQGRSNIKADTLLEEFTISWVRSTT